MAIISRPGWANKSLIHEAKGGKYEIFNRVTAVLDKNSLGKSYYNNIFKIIDSVIADKPPFNATGLSSLIWKLLNKFPALGDSDAQLTETINKAINLMNITDDEIIHSANLVGKVFAKEKYGFEAVPKSELSEFDVETEHPKKFDMSKEEIIEKFGEVVLKLNTEIFNPERVDVNGYPYHGEFHGKPVVVTLSNEHESGTKLGNVPPDEFMTFRLLKKGAGGDVNDLDIDRSIISVSFKEPSLNFNAPDEDELPSPPEKEAIENKEYMKLAASVKRDKDIAARRAGKKPLIHDFNNDDEIESMFSSLQQADEGEYDESFRLSKEDRNKLILEQRHNRKQHLQVIEEKYKKR